MDALGVVGRNFDMQTEFMTKKGVDDQLMWPRENMLWVHSDLREVGFVYLYKIFDDFVSRGRLSQ